MLLTRYAQLESEIFTSSLLISIKNIFLILEMQQATLQVESNGRVTSLQVSKMPKIQNFRQGVTATCFYST